MILRLNRVTLGIILLAGVAVLVLAATHPAAWATPAQHRVGGTLPTPGPRPIQGIVFEDQNCDGVYDTGDPGLSGVSITLASAITAVRTTSTTYGTYLFENLVAGELYTVTEIDPPGYFSTSPNAVVVTASATSTVWVDFADHPVLEVLLEGIVYEDHNRNGAYDAGEPTIPGVPVTLSSDAAPTRTTTSTAGGYVFADLIAGELYTVTEADPPGYFSTSPNVVTVTASCTPTIRVDFGDHRFIQALPLVVRGQ